MGPDAPFGGVVGDGGLFVRGGGAGGQDVDVLGTGHDGVGDDLDAGGLGDDLHGVGGGEDARHGVEVVGGEDLGGKKKRESYTGCFITNPN